MPTSQPVTPVQLLRSQVLNKRPNPAQLLLGQPAVNINSEQPGLFFSDETNATLIKIGPCSVGPLAPNTGATGAPGQLGNTLGELWLDTTSTFDAPGPILKVWGSRVPGDPPEWIDCTPYRYANTIVSDTEPTIGLQPDGTLWWDSGTGLMYVLYNDGSNRQWTQVSGNPVA
jgi:hypothetical protein